MSERLGPVIESPQPQPAMDADSQASTPTAPSARPVTGHGHAAVGAFCTCWTRPMRISASNPRSDAIVSQRGSVRATSTEGGHRALLVVTQA
jgi:hypothetical protein